MLISDSLNFTALPTSLCALSVQAKLQLPAEEMLQQLTSALRQLPVLQIFKIDCFHCDLQLPLQQLMALLCCGAVTFIALNICNLEGVPIQCGLPLYLQCIDLTGNKNIKMDQWKAVLPHCCRITLDAGRVRGSDTSVFDEAAFALPIEYGPPCVLLPAPQLNTAPC